MQTHHTWFIHSSGDGHLDYFYLMTTMNIAVHTFIERFLCGYRFSFLLGVHLGVEFLGHTVILRLNFWGIATLFFKMAALFSIPTCSLWRFQFLQILTNTCYSLFFFFYYSHTNWCEEVSLWFWFVFSLWLCWAYFHVLIGHLCIFFRYMSIQILCPFLNWIFLSCFKDFIYFYF